MCFLSGILTNFFWIKSIWSHDSHLIRGKTVELSMQMFLQIEHIFEKIQAC